MKKNRRKIQVIEPVRARFSGRWLRLQGGRSILGISVQILSVNENLVVLRGAWRDRCFPEPFSCFLHETGLECLKIISARWFLLKCQRKDSKKAKEHRQFRGVLGRWRTAAIDRTTFHACQRRRKTAFSQFFLGFGMSFGEEKPFLTAMPVSNKKQEFKSSKKESNCSMTSECVRTDSILPRGAGLEHGRCKQSIFSVSIFGILVERLSF